MTEILESKNCLVTGASGGIGKEIVKILAQKGCNLFLTSKNETKLVDLSTDIKSINDKIQIQYCSGDLTKIENTEKIIKKIRDGFPKIDVLINCAGIFTIKPISESSLEDFENCFGVNIRAPFLFCKEFSKDMIENKWGRIVNLGSSSSYGGFENGSIYCSSKHSILGLSRSLHIELKKHNVRVYCVSPASTKTEMAKISTDQDFNTFLNPKDVAEYIVFSISFDKEMTVEESRLNRMVLK